MEQKRGQAAAAGAAVLLAVIAALLIMFVVLVQPEERAKILGEEKAVSAKRSSTAGEPAVLLQNLLTEKPGRIDYLAQREVEHPLPAVTLLTKKESKVIAEKKYASAKRGVFSEEQDSFRFSLPELAPDSKTIFVFRVNELLGDLQLKLNGRKLLDSVLALGSATPIPLSQDDLEQVNELTISVSSPGLAFWKVHRVSLADLQIISDVLDTKAQTAKQTFLVSETEKKNLEAVSLRFQPTCTYEDVAPLRITLNEEVIYEGIPDCAVAFVPLEIDPAKIQQGENELVFTATTGAYLLSHLTIVSELKEVDFPTYYFPLSSEQFEEIKSGEKRVRLELHFVDAGTTKFGDVLVNGHLHHFDTKEVTEVLDISADIVRGDNAVKIKPRRTLEVRELEVNLVK